MIIKYKRTIINPFTNSPKFIDFITSIDLKIESFINSDKIYQNY